MSWIDKELKRRAVTAQPAVPSQPIAASESARMQDLWTRFLDVNKALPSDIRLLFEKSSPPAAPSAEAVFVEWLRAPNGAALGFAGNAVRYLWPAQGERKSNNFWIGWSAPQQRYVLVQRISASAPPAVAEYRFDDTRADYMVKCLVLGKRIRTRSVKKKRLWLF